MAFGPKLVQTVLPVPDSQVAELGAAFISSSSADSQAGKAEVVSL